MPFERADAPLGWPCREVPPAAGLLVPGHHGQENTMLGTVLIVILVLILLGVLPTWGDRRSWGYGPSSARAHPRDPDRAGADRAS